MNQEPRAISTNVLRTEKKEERPLFSAIRAAYALRMRKSSVILVDLVMAALGFVFAITHAVCGVFPFGIALLAAVEGQALAVLIGTFAGSLAMGEVSGLYAVLYLSVFFFRMLLSYPRPRRVLPESPAFFAEDPSLRVAVGGAVAVFMALYELVLVGAKSYAVWFALCAVLLIPLLTLFFCFVTATAVTLPALLVGEPIDGKRAAFGRHALLLFQIGALVFLFCVCFSLRSYVFFGVSVGKCAAAFFTFFAARRFGSLRGCAVGLTVGLAGEAIYAPAFGILGLLAGLYQSIGMPLALAVSVAASGAFCAYVGGVTGFLAVTPEVTVTSLLGWGLLHKLPRASGGFLEKNDSPAPPPPSREEEEVLSCLSGAFSVVSDKLRVAAEEEKNPTAEEYEQLCRHAKESLCRRCPADGACAESAAVDAALRTAAIRLLCGEDIGEQAGLCEGYGKMVDEVRRAVSLLAQKKRQGGAKGALSVDYALLSRILRETAEERAATTARDAVAEESLAALLRSHGIYAEEIRVTGGRAKQVTLTDIHSTGGGLQEQTLLSYGQQACGKELSFARISYDGKKAFCHMESRPRFVAVGGLCTLPAGEDEPSGDRAVYLQGEDYMAYALLCDGMGSGTRAAGAAELCVSVLSSLLAAGVRRETALSLLNNLICTGEECSVALDLLSLDLLTGKATFLKSGAAASYVGRGNSLFRIRSRTLPMGILRMVDSEEAGFELRGGDTVILLSDGVMSEGEEGAWLKELLNKEGEKPADVLAKRILETAAQNRDKRDDMTALVVQLAALPL